MQTYVQISYLSVNMASTLRVMKDIQYFSGVLAKEGVTYIIQTPWGKKLLVLLGFQTVCLDVARSEMPPTVQ